MPEFDRIEDYKPSEQSNARLRDDWRIAAGWYASAKDPNVEMKWTQEQIVDFVEKVTREIAKRVDAGEMKHTFDPDNMTDAAAELFRKVQKRIDRELPVKQSLESVIQLNQQVSRVEEPNQSIQLNQPFAKVEKSGSNRGEEVRVEDVQEWYNKPIVLRRGFVKLVGGIANHGSSKGDIDLLIAWPTNTPDSVVHPVRFRLGRALGSMAERIQFLLDEFHGPFTSYVPLYDLVLVPSSYKDVVWQAGESQAEKSKSENKVEPLRWFYPLKGSVGYHKLEEYDVSGIKKHFEKSDYPLYVQKKYDGLRMILMRDGEEVVIRTEGGDDVTDRLPSIVTALKNLDVETVTLDAEVEGWKKEHHWGRAEISGYVHANGEPSDEMVVANVFDVLYVDGQDLHNKKYSERYDVLSEVGIEQSTVNVPDTPGLNLVPTCFADTEKELKSCVKKMSEAKESEGAMIKAANSEYPLSGETDKWVKYKLMADVHAVVVERIETEREGVYNYRVAVEASGDSVVDEKMELKDGETHELNVLGKTFNSDIKMDKGDICTVVFHTLFKYVDGKYSLNGYEMRVKEERPEEEVPDSSEKAVEIAKNAGLLQLKKEEEQAECRKFVIQHHYRGQSAHADFRYEVNSELRGFTIADQEPGVIKEDVESLKRAKELDGQEENWKYGSGVQMLAIPKGIEPHEWLTKEGKVEPGEVGATRFEYGVFSIVDEGCVDLGAMKSYFQEFFLHGDKFNGRYVFRQIKVGKRGEKLPALDISAIDQNMLEDLSVAELKDVIIGLRRAISGEIKQQKGSKDDLIKEVLELVKVAKEYGINSTPQSVLTPISKKKEFMWLFWKPDDQEPYVLSNRAVKKKWIPSYGKSALPSGMQKSIPRKYKYWEFKDRNVRRKKRDELVELIQKGKVKVKQELPEFVLQRHWFKGQKVVRAGPSVERFLVNVKVDGKYKQIVLDKSPIYEDNITADVKDVSEEWIKKGRDGVYDIPPGEEGNPTKATGAWVEWIDSGGVSVEVKENKYILNFDGDKLEGKFTVEKSDGLWVWRK